MSSTLGELERKLRELEQELARVSDPAEPSSTPLVPPAPTPIAQAISAPHAAPPLERAPLAAAPPPVPESALAPPSGNDALDHAETDDRLAALETQLDALRAYGAELQASAGRLLDAYRSALTEAERPHTAPAAAIPVTPAAPQPPPPTASEPAQADALRSPIQGHDAQDAIMARFIAAQAASQQAAHDAAEQEAPVSPATPAAPLGPLSVNPTPDMLGADPQATQLPAAAAVAPHAVGAVDQRYVGAVTIDAGPFADIGSLSAFEQSIARVPGVRDVYVRGFQGQRAMIDVDFATPTAVVPELAAVTSVPFIVERADATGLVVTIPLEGPDAS